MEIFKQYSKTEMRHQPAVDRFKRYGRKSGRIVSEISAFIRTDGQADMAISIRLVILIKNIYTIWCRKRFLLPVTYFPTNVV